MKLEKGDLLAVRSSLKKVLENLKDLDYFSSYEKDISEPREILRQESIREIEQILKLLTA